MSSRYRLADFVEVVESQYKATEPETFWLCEPAIRSLLTGGVLGEWINHELRSLVADPQRLGDWTGTEAVLHRGKGWTASVAVFDSPRRFIHALPFMAFYAPLETDLTGDRYRLPEGY